jgi:hypothetical protein
VLIVLKSGSLTLLEPSRPVQACNGIALPYWHCSRITRLASFHVPTPQFRSRCTIPTFHSSHPASLGALYGPLVFKCCGNLCTEKAFTGTVDLKRLHYLEYFEFIAHRHWSAMRSPILQIVQKVRTYRLVLPATSHVARRHRCYVNIHVYLIASGSLSLILAFYRLQLSLLTFHLTSAEIKFRCFLFGTPDMIWTRNQSDHI